MRALGRLWRVAPPPLTLSREQSELINELMGWRITVVRARSAEAALDVKDEQVTSQPTYVSRPLTLCVGGVTFGGVGKTQVIEHLTRRALTLGLSVAVLCHGYRARVSKREHTAQRLSKVPEWGNLIWGDEAAMLRRWLPDSVTLWVGGTWRDKWERACSLSPDLILCDGGLYTSELPRHLGILVLSPKLKMRLVPLGDLTRPRSTLPSGVGYMWWWVNAEMTADTRERDAAHHLPYTLGALRHWMTALDVRSACYSEVEPIEWVNALGERLSLVSLSGTRVGLICAIARPNRFIEMTRLLNIQVTRQIIRRDHAPLNDHLARYLKRIRDEPINDDDP